MSVGRSPGWVRAAQIILGIFTIILSIFALAFPGATFVSAIVILSIILFFVGIEKIITGIFLPQRSKAATIGLGVLVLIFAGLAIAFPAATAFVALIFIGVALLFGGCARIAEGISGHHSGWQKFALIGVGGSGSYFVDPSDGITCIWSGSRRICCCHSPIDTWHSNGSGWSIRPKIPESRRQVPSCRINHSLFF